MAGCVFCCSSCQQLSLYILPPSPPSTATSKSDEGEKTTGERADREKGQRVADQGPRTGSRVALALLSTYGGIHIQFTYGGWRAAHSRPSAAKPLRCLGYFAGLNDAVGGGGGAVVERSHALSVSARDREEGEAQRAEREPRAHVITKLAREPTDARDDTRHTARHGAPSREQIGRAHV